MDYILLNIDQKLINLTFLLAFRQSVSAICKHIKNPFNKKTLPAKRTEMFIWKKTPHQNEIPVL